MTQYRVVKSLPFPAEMIWTDGKCFWAETGVEVDFEMLEEYGFIERVEEPAIHLIENGALTHALADASGVVHGTMDPDKVTCETCAARLR